MNTTITISDDYLQDWSLNIVRVNDETDYLVVSNTSATLTMTLLTWVHRVLMWNPCNDKWLIINAEAAQ